jgi:hypothetical protein
MSDMNNNTQFERTSFFNIQYILTSSVSQLSDIQNIRDELMNPVIHITEPKPLDFTILGCMTITAGFDYLLKQKLINIKLLLYPA